MQKQRIKYEMEDVKVYLFILKDYASKSITYLIISTCLIAASNSPIFFCTSSIATSIGVKTILNENDRKMFQKI